MSEHIETRVAGWRVASAIVGGLLIIGLGLFNAVQPDRQGSLPGASTSGSLVTGVRAGSVWAKAGLRPGDRFAPMAPISQLIFKHYPRAGTMYDVPVTRDGATRTIRVRAAAVADVPGGRIIDLLIEMACVVLAVIVLLRARRDDLAGTLCGYTMWLAATIASADGFVSADTAWSAFLLNGVAQTVGAVLATYFVFRLIGLFPEGKTPVQRLALRLAPVMGLTGGTFIVASSFNLPLLFLVQCVADVIGIAMLLWITLHVAPENRARMRWFASTLLLFQFSAQLLQDGRVVMRAPPSLLDMVLFYVTNLGPIGPIYAVLRHRVLDIDVVVSRSAIYAGVSVFVVGFFIGAEWLAGRLADAFAAESQRGFTTEIVSFAVALAVGLSARRVHTLIERRINGVFFSARTRRLESLKRFAHEADISDSREGLLNLTYETLSQTVETPSVALYLAEGSGFSLVRASVAAAPVLVDKNDRLVLQLLRWPQTFVFEDAGTLREWLIVPLMVRTNVIGFMACGPKTDHTRYLADELSALETLAHHVATSYAFISSPLERLRAVPAMGTA